MGIGTALAIAGIFTCCIIALNIIYGFYLSVNGPETTSSTRAQRWFVLLFGLQWIIAVKLEEYMSRGEHQTRRVFVALALATGLWAVAVISAVEVGQGAAILLVNALVLAYVISVAVAARLQRRVAPPPGSLVR